MRSRLVVTAAVLATLVFGVGAVAAAEAEPGGKLLLTGGVSALEGGSGGGLATWALIGGNETSRGVGGSVHAT